MARAARIGRLFLIRAAANHLPVLDSICYDIFGFFFGKLDHASAAYIVRDADIIANRRAVG